MRTNHLMNMKADLNSLGIEMPKAVGEHERILEAIAAVPKHKGRTNLDGVTAKTVADEIERRALDALASRERVNQARLISDAANEAIDRALIDATEDIIEALRPAVMKAHAKITEASALIGELTADNAIATDEAVLFREANDAWATIDTAARIRSRLYSLDRPDLDRSAERRLTMFRFASLQAWKTYDSLPDLGSGAANHAASVQVEGVTFEWLSTDAAEQQSRALGKAQHAEINGADAGMVFDEEAQAFRVGRHSWMHI